MKYNLKNKLRNLACISLCAGGMWVLNACGDYLDVVPDNVGTIEHSFSNRNEAEKYLFTCYSYIPEYHSERANVGLMGGMNWLLSILFRVAMIMLPGVSGWDIRM